MRRAGLVLVLTIAAWLAQTDVQAPSTMAQAVEEGLDPSWASDGRRIAFVSGGQIYAMPADGGEQTRLTTPRPNQDSREPQCSPDGQRIALTRNFVLGTPAPFTPAPGGFISRTPSTRHILVMNTDGSGEKQLTTSGDNYFGKWVPDSRRLVFVSDRDGSRAIFIVNVDGTQERRISAPSRGFDFGLSLSPDGQRVAFTSTRDGRRQIYVVKLDGSEFTRITSTGENHSPTWSSDSRRIAFVSDRGDWHVYVMNADGSNQRRLTAADRNLDPVWSPDGNRIAFRVTRDDDIYVMSPDGGSPTRLTSTGKVTAAPTWSPDGQRIAFTSRVPRPGGENLQIFVVSVDGSGLKRLTGP